MWYEPDHGKPQLPYHSLHVGKQTVFHQYVSDSASSTLNCLQISAKFKINF